MILVVNAGSSSIKVELFGTELAPVLSGFVSEIGGKARIGLADDEEACDAPDHDAALRALLSRLERAGHPVGELSAAGHRVVHGGENLTRPVLITPDIERAIERAIPLAPLHNPHNLAAIRALRIAVPDLPQVAAFDTGFHATNPDLARRYAVPPGVEAEGIQRYGFHGISYESLTARLPDLIGAPLPARILAAHLGNGASLCAIHHGRSVATTMGYSPLEGLTMGTRAGSIDGNAVLRLAELHGIEAARRILNHESGLLGLGGASDMRALHAADTREAGFAIAHFCYWAVRHAGSMIAAMRGLDAIAFTGGIGENDAVVRAAIVEGLGWTGAAIDETANAGNALRLAAAASPIHIQIVPAEEEAHIARAVRGCLGKTG